MADPLRHRQTKGAATDMVDLTPPRHISTLPRPCENAQEPTRRRIVFSIALFPIAATALFLFRLTKSRRTFYAQIECLCFHTASTLCRLVGSIRTRSA